MTFLERVSQASTFDELDDVISRIGFSLSVHIPKVRERVDDVFCEDGIDELEYDLLVGCLERMDEEGGVIRIGIGL